MTCSTVLGTMLFFGWEWFKLDARRSVMRFGGADIPCGHL